MRRANMLAAQTDSLWVHALQHQWFKCFFLSPLKSQLRVVLGQQRFNVTGPNTRTFGVENYFFPKQFSVFNPTLHDIGNPHWTHARIPMTHINYKTSCPHSETHFRPKSCVHSCTSVSSCVPVLPPHEYIFTYKHTHWLLGVAVSLGHGVSKSATCVFIHCFLSDTVLGVFCVSALPVLIKLKKENGRCVKRTPFIRPICLPDKNMTFPDFHCCTISGWGHTHESEFWGNHD